MNQDWKNGQLALLVCIAFVFLTAFSQDGNLYPQDYFRSPVGYTMTLSGTFGELRPNHFHAGIDIKPNKGIGDAILSAADGYVSRIKVSSRGYGNALYIDHPNGYTTVYAHLNAFSPEIEAYVKKQQYARQEYEVEIYPQPYELTVSRSQRIGGLGNSGRSFGPHLHYEIRETSSEKPINPLLFGYKVRDSKPPMLKELKVYGLDDSRAETSSRSITLKSLGKGKYDVPGLDTISVAAWRCGLGIKAYDLLNGASNWNGVYQIEMFVNNMRRYNWTAETFSFDETRYLNAHIDYLERLQKKAYFNRLYRLPGNQLQMYEGVVQEGVIELSKYDPSEVKIVVTDVEGNTSTVRFFVKRKEVKQATKAAYNYVLPYNEESIVREGAFEAYLPQGSLYEDKYLMLRSSPDPSAGTYSAVYEFGDKEVPLHKYIDIKIRANNIPESLRSKAFIADCSGGGISARPSSWEGDQLVAKTRSFGNYCILTDTKPPVIKATRLKKDMRKYSSMQFRLSDDKTGVESYDGYINDQWVLFEYNSKNGRITYQFDERCPKGQNTVRIVARDGVGNVKEYSYTFRR